MAAAIPASVEQVGARPTYTIIKVHELATQRIELEWRPVLDWYEHSELAQYNEIIKWVPKNPRLDFFNQTRYFNEIVFKGGWGPELLHWRLPQERGYVWCTETRQQEIQKWIQDSVDYLAPGND
jgi:hypothetical protein